MSNKKFRATNCSLDKIVDIKSIAELSVYDAVIRRHARMLTENNRDIADEIVQIVYISLDKYFKKYPDKSITGGFVSLSLRNRLKNYHNANNRFDFGDSTNEAHIEDEVDVSFYENEDIQSKLADEKLYNEMYSRFDSLEWYERKVLEYSLEMSMADLARASDIGYQNLVYSLNRAKAKIGVIAKQK